MQNEQDNNGRQVPSVWLTHAAVMSSSLDDSVEFYRGILGLQLRTVGDDPIRKGRRRAVMTDSEGRDIVEIIEMAEMAHPSIPGRGGIHHIGFTLPVREWHSLRSRMDANAYPYHEIGRRLFVRDSDGLILEIEPLSPSSRGATASEGAPSSAEASPASESATTTTAESAS